MRLGSKVVNWSEVELIFLRANYLLYGDDELAALLKRSKESVVCKRKRIGLYVPSEVAKERQAKNPPDTEGEKNGFWKGGISKNKYHYKKLQIERYPERIKARAIISDLVRSGKLVRLPCEICGEVKSQAHHVDYTRPLEVRWLCRKHHREVHGGRH